VTGKGYAADGIVKHEGTQVRYNSHPSFFKVIECGAVCNNSHIFDHQVTGSPTEAALLTLALKVCFLLTIMEIFNNLKRKLIIHY
jgi:magnesium-transporting ATPase (P-type)